MGAKLPVAAVPESHALPGAELSSLLASVERWAAKDARRRFKLWYEDGWNCYIWPNRYKPKLFESSNRDLVTCLSDCWSKLKAASRRSKRPSTAS